MNENYFSRRIKLGVRFEKRVSPCNRLLDCIRALMCWNAGSISAAGRKGRLITSDLCRQFTGAWHHVPCRLMPPNCCTFLHTVWIQWNTQPRWSTLSSKTWLM